MTTYPPEQQNYTGGVWTTQGPAAFDGPPPAVSYNAGADGVWTTQNHNYATPQGGNYGMMAPQTSYSAGQPWSEQAPQQQEKMKLAELPYAPPPMPGYYAPLPATAPPPYEAAVNSMYPPAAPSGQSSYSVPLQPQPINMQPQNSEATEQAALVAIESGKSAQECRTCCKVSCSLIGHLGFLACAISIIYHLCTLNIIPHNTALVFGLSGGMMAFAYLLIMCEVGCSDTYGYVKNFLQEGSVQHFWNTLQRTRPSVTWNVECYHYETRRHTVRRNGKTHTETRRVKVVTFRDSLMYTFSQWRDVSPPSPQIQRGTALRVAMYKTFTFANEMSRQNYSTQKDNFYRRNVGRDTHISFIEIFDIEGFKERLTAYADEESKKTCMSSEWYCLCSALLCTWPYRYWFRRVTDKAHYTVIKEFGV